MAFQVSPGVNTSEIDLTAVVPGVSSVDAGFSGAFRWGPINDVTLIDSEDLLVQTFQKPDANTYLSFFTACAGPSQPHLSLFVVFARLKECPRWTVEGLLSLGNLGKKSCAHHVRIMYGSIFGRLPISGIISLGAFRT